MIRSLGSSLLAKAATGSLSRKKDETRITKPEIPGKAATGTSTRDLTQETNIVPAAPGSEKVIRSAPGIESASLPGVASRNVPLVAGMGMTTNPGASAPGVSDNGMFAGGSSAPASVSGQAARQATAVSGGGQVLGAVAQSRAARAAEAAKATQASEAAQVQAPQSPNYSVGSFFPGIGSFGGRVSAEGEGNVEIPKNFLQAVVATLSKPGTKGEAWGTNPAVTQSGVGSLSKPGATVKAVTNSISSALRSVTQKAQNAISKLRSKWGW